VALEIDELAVDAVEEVARLGEEVLQKFHVDVGHDDPQKV
jgi:hypothetical protein